MFTLQVFIYFFFFFTSSVLHFFLILIQAALLEFQFPQIRIPTPPKMATLVPSLLHSPNSPLQQDFWRLKLRRQHQTPGVEILLHPLLKLATNSFSHFVLWLQKTKIWRFVCVGKLLSRNPDSPDQKIKKEKRTQKTGYKLQRKKMAAIWVGIDSGSVFHVLSEAIKPRSSNLEDVERRVWV